MSGVQSHSLLHSELEANMNYQTSSQKALQWFSKNGLLSMLYLVNLSFLDTLVLKGCQQFYDT